MNIIILGPQGSGKGTQADILSKNFNLFHMEPGKIFRKIAETDARIKQMVDSGTLVPDDETIKIIENHIINENGGKFDNLIFDGYPRTVSQYEALKSWSKSKGFPINLVINLKINDTESVQRISGRRVCEKCGESYNLQSKKPKVESICDECGGTLYHRDDDKPDVIAKRLLIYHKNTAPILDLAKNDGILIEIDGSGSIDEVEKLLLGIIKEYARKNNN
jgi:adenylate kinase